MACADMLEQTIALLQHQGRISYGALKRRFELDDTYLEWEAYYRGYQERKKSYAELRQWSDT